MVRRFKKLALSLAVVGMSAVASAPAWATGTSFTAPSGFDAPTIFTTVVDNNKTTILYGLGATAFLAVVGGLAKKLIGRAKRAM